MRWEGWPSATSKVVCLLGDPVDHSLSPLLHNTAFAAMGVDFVSVVFRVRRGDAETALGGLRALSIRGAAVTMPHKAAVAGLVDEPSEVATLLGAANTVVNEDGRLLGDNTDGEGFVASLRHGAGFDPAGRRCLVAGAGGAGRAVVLALARAGAAEVVVVNRDPGRATVAAALAGGAGRTGTPSDAAEADLVVDATPTGMAGTGAEHDPALVDASLLGPGQLAVDLVYHPRLTPWLLAARERGAAVLGGLGMLVHQAAGQIERWTGAEPPLEAMWAAAEAAVGPRPGPAG